MTAIETLMVSADGVTLVSDGTMLWYLTPCHQASAKGSSMAPTGVVCRSCYEALPEWMGDAADANDADGVARMRGRLS